MLHIFRVKVIINKISGRYYDILEFVRIRVVLELIMGDQSY